MDWIMFVCLAITHIVAYYIGKGDGRCESGLDVEAFEAVKKYEIDKRFEHMRWVKEREERKDA